jgi:hypothetical protein
MAIRIFDFDLTITKEHTFSNRHAYTPRNNIKSKIESYFLHDEDNIAAITTFHDNTEYVKSYLETILKQKLTLINTIDFQHDKLSVYQVKGLSTPIVISTLHENNFNLHHDALVQTGKNSQIRHVLRYLKNECGIATIDHDIQFFDDSINNIFHAKLLADELGGIQTHHVTTSNPFSINESIKNIQQHGYTPVISNNDYIELTLKINDALTEYVKNTQKLSTRLSIFHRHGTQGIERANLFCQTLSLKDENIYKQQQILDYLADSTMGNTHPHSFRTMLLQEMLDDKTASLNEIAGSFNKYLEQLRSQWQLNPSLIDFSATTLA